MDMNCAILFAKVVEARGFSAAARSLGMPKTTLSKKVGDLEAELGVRLLNRTTRAVSPTEAGARAYAHIVTAIRQLDQAEREVRAIRRDPAGMLTVAAPGAIGAHFLMPAITAFLARFPTVSVTLLAVEGPVDLAEARVDILVWPGAAPPAGHAMRLVAEVEIALYASRAYLAAAPPLNEPDDLRVHRAVAFVQAMTGGKFLWRLRSGSQRSLVAPRAAPRFGSNDPNAVLAAIIAGSGVGALPTRFVAQASTADLVPVLPGWRADPIALNAIFRDGSASTAKTRLFLDAAVAWFGQG